MSSAQNNVPSVGSQGRAKRSLERFTANSEAIEKKRAVFGRVYIEKRRSLRLLSAWEAYDHPVSVAEEGVEPPKRNLRADGAGPDFVGD
jgi:hypothetical protein